MRKDMAKVVTGSPRRGHASPSSKWGRRRTKDEYAVDDHGASCAPVSRHRQYGWNAKEFSDSLGPLRGYLRKPVGRPWDTVWSEIATTLDSRSMTGQHIFDHIRLGSGVGRLARRRRTSVPQAPLGCDRTGRRTLRSSRYQPDALPEWRRIRRGVASALILTESLRTLDRFRLRANLADDEVATRREVILRLIASLELVELEAVVLERAAQPMPTELGTLDAIHLATAVLWKDMSQEDLVMATHDVVLGTAARAHGLAVVGVAAK